MFDNLPGFMEKSAEREPGMEASNLLAATSMKWDERRPAIDFWRSNFQGNGGMRNAERVVTGVSLKLDNCDVMDDWEEVAKEEMRQLGLSFKTLWKTNNEAPTQLASSFGDNL